MPELDAAVDGDAATAVPSAEAVGAAGTPADGTTPASGDSNADAASAAFALVFDSTADIAEKITHVEDGAALESTMTDYKTSGDAMDGFTVAPSDVVVEGDTATITYDVLFGGTSAGYPPQTGTATLVGGVWTVSKADF
ncbi:MAG: putative iron siderophore transporter iron siderophore-binding protein, partial [Ilumatobacteraceae bacterium]|nr:putative iron siderophore transporter iron siderophore-binding protein [Ilumatobacteraceae bacterium]